MADSADSRTLSLSMADEIVAGTLGRGGDVLMPGDRGTIRIVWHPAGADMQDARHGRVLDYWMALDKIDGVADTRDIDVFQLRAALGNIMLLDVEEDGTRFRYRVYGSEIARVTDFDMTGRGLDETPTTAPVLSFLTASYMAVCRRRDPLYTVHFAPTDITMQSWHRLLLPFGQGGAVRRILVCMIPLARENT